MSGIPTARSVDHVGITVPDLDQAVAFFVDVLGSEPIFTAGPFEDPDGDWMPAHLGVHPRTRLRFAMVRSGPTQIVELLEYDAPDARDQPARNSDPGAAHLAIHVDDPDAAIAYLRQQPGVEVLEEETNGGGPLAGLRWAFFTAPWGLPFELVHWRPGMPYEGQTDERLIGPARSWDERPPANMAP